MPASSPLAQVPPRRPARRRSRGQVVVIFAGSIFLLIGMVAVVVDVSWYWANSLRVQRAADAAALAGAIYLPGSTLNAYKYADIEATKNGYTSGGGTVVTPLQDTANGGTDPRQLDVSVSAPVGMFFMRGPSAVMAAGGPALHAKLTLVVILCGLVGYSQALGKRAREAGGGPLLGKLYSVRLAILATALAIIVAAVIAFQ